MLKKSKLIKRIKSRSGETIAEVLVALLISALGIVLLAGMINSSTSMVTGSKDKIRSYVSADNELVDPSGAGTDGEVVLDVKLHDDCPLSIEVTCYENEVANEKVISYKEK